MIITTYCWSRSLVAAVRAKLVSEQGASLVEYALLVGLIALVCIIAITFFGGSVSKSFSNTGSQVGG